MLRRTAPAVSFTTSHMAMMLRASRPVFGNDMTSVERHQAAWDEMPFWFVNKSRKEFWEWDWKCRYELGIRDNWRTTKFKTMLFWSIPFLAIFLLYGYGWPPFYHAIFGEMIPHMNRENGVEYSKRMYGIDVWCADGKFAQPYIHINPPLFTMTVEEL